MNDFETMYKWRLEFKLAKYSYQYEFHDFLGTDADCKEEWKRWTDLGYDIRDAHNLGEYVKPTKTALEIYMENRQKNDKEFEKE